MSTLKQLVNQIVYNRNKVEAALEAAATGDEAQVLGKIHGDLTALAEGAKALLLAEPRLTMERVVADPELLWDLCTKGPPILGPWREATDPRRKVSVHRGMWRLSPSGDDGVVVYPSRQIRDPDPYDYTDRREDEDYVQAVKFAEHMRTLWKPWTYTANLWKTQTGDFFRGQTQGYADTREEAQRLADAWVRARGVVLYDGPEAATAPSDVKIEALTNRFANVNRKRTPVEIGQVRRDPDCRYLKIRKQHRDMKVVGIDGERAELVDQFTGLFSKIKVSTLEKWDLVV